jgi:hypothetical protein
MKQQRFIELDKNVKPNPTCAQARFYVKGVFECKLAEFCKNKADFGGLKYCKEDSTNKITTNEY